MTTLQPSIIEQLDYRSWWYVTAYKIRTVARCIKIRAAETAKLKAGATFNTYGDLTGHTVGHVVNGRHFAGVRVSLMHGFRKWRRCYSPIKSVAYLTTGLLDAVESVLSLVEKFTRAENERKAAHKSGFKTVSAWKKSRKQQAAEIADARNEAWVKGREQGMEIAKNNSGDPHSDLNDVGIAPDRDKIEGDSLLLMNFIQSRSRRVRLTDFMALTGPKIDRRNAGWQLPAYTPPPAPPVIESAKKRLLSFLPERKLAL